MASLAMAKAFVLFLPFRLWRDRLGLPGDATSSELQQAIAAARDFEWVADRFPSTAKCLPRAMALSWTLRKRRVPHAFVFAARPESRRGADDDLHAWVEVAGERVMGDLPGPWIETLRLG